MRGVLERLKTKTRVSNPKLICSVLSLSSLFKIHREDKESTEVGCTEVFREPEIFVKLLKK